MIAILPYLVIFPLLLLIYMFYSSVILISLISIGQLYLARPIHSNQFSHNIVQLVDTATHTKGNILDLVLVNLENIISGVKAGSNLLVNSSSDHFLISFSILSVNSRNHQCYISSSAINFSKLAYDRLNTYLLDIDFEFSYVSADIEFLWSSLKRIILVGFSFSFCSNCKASNQDKSKMV